MNTWLDRGRLRRPGRGPKTNEESANSQFINPPHTQNFGHSPFKENCPDLRNSKVGDIVDELRSFGVEVFVHDPLADAAEAEREYGVQLSSWQALPRADAIVAAVAHREIAERDVHDLGRKVIRDGCFIDVKAKFDAAALRQL